MKASSASGLCARRMVRLAGTRASGGDLGRLSVEGVEVVLVLGVFGPPAGAPWPPRPAEPRVRLARPRPRCAPEPHPPPRGGPPPGAPPPPPRHPPPPRRRLAAAHLSAAFVTELRRGRERGSARVTGHRGRNLTGRNPRGSVVFPHERPLPRPRAREAHGRAEAQIGRASCRERV